MAIGVYLVIIPVTGPPEYAELRINLAQAVQAIGTVIGPVLGSYVFFKEVEDSATALRSVQWVYLAIAIFVFCLAVVFYLVAIPEVTGASSPCKKLSLLLTTLKTPTWHIRPKPHMRLEETGGNHSGGSIARSTPLLLSSVIMAPRVCLAT